VNNANLINMSCYQLAEVARAIAGGRTVPVPGSTSIVALSGQCEEETREIVSMATDRTRGWPQIAPEHVERAADLMVEIDRKRGLLPDRACSLKHARTYGLWALCREGIICGTVVDDPTDIRLRLGEGEDAFWNAQLLERSNNHAFLDPEPEADDEDQ